MEERAGQAKMRVYGRGSGRRDYYKLQSSRVKDTTMTLGRRREPNYLQLEVLGPYGPQLLV